MCKRGAKCMNERPDPKACFDPKACLQPSLKRSEMQARGAAANRNAGRTARIPGKAPARDRHATTATNKNGQSSTAAHRNEVAAGKFANPDAWRFHAIATPPRVAGVVSRKRRIVVSSNV